MANTRLNVQIDSEINAPNATTMTAFEEGEQMLMDSNTPRFSSVEELFEDLES